MLHLEHVDIFYGDFQAVWDASLEVTNGEVVALLGLNGSGKSSVINVISGLVAPRSGTVTFEETLLNDVPVHRRVDLGIVHVPERRRVFPFMSVEDNLLVGAYLPRARSVVKERLTYCFELFPVLAQRSHQMAGTLSGGEQQQLSIARGLMACPRFLLVDEPFLGLSPAMVGMITDVLRRIAAQGVTLLFVEQNVRQALSFSHRGYLLESGRIVAHGPAADLLKNDVVRSTYLGMEE